MPRDSDPRAPQPSEVGVQDMQMMQILTETRRNAAERPDDPAWRGIAEQIDRILGAVGSAAPGEPPEAWPQGIDRVDRTRIVTDEATGEHVAAALMALEDQPDETRLRLASEALDRLEETVR